ncbi:lipid A export permease/ATP-binding protein MsbA [Herbaspirillum seropedicae]|uniref:ABC-type multidrug transport system, ATPase and permease components protein n=1 Tax=Herbaspirillum seropedicae (strain SmR1) TaxID=757424 RepID=D8IQD3_HERSS|nr:lipid A export permease/ATP-binding protein MsbA [Herbaspirillum seropedicae]ADJ65045.1 ABC-type multidrug transport system, ATPase and permease components protein [Herbaspirillum seropedicae SmR1]AKN66919.1 lipid transporter ATP-binding/permease [Herbaspirillum seropedicae]MDR6395294.1 subfamily B ATP-binding cassette protein MsbA [Herbaspirillum seropedicae]NQE28069.1 lipid transporter ATP-binding/permease [Herbaspirillum seropedicae]UMU22916.1 lipid A export permease/ATP-binding protein 
MLSNNMKRLAALHWPYKKRLAVAFIAMIVTAATEPVVPYIFQVLLDKGFVGKPAFSLWLVPVAVIGIFFIRGIATFTSSYMMTWVSTRILNELRRQMFARMLDLPLHFYATNTVGKVINSMMFEVQQIIDMVTKVFTSILRSALTVLGLLAWLLYLNWVLTIVTLVLLPLVTLVVRTTGKRLKKLNRDSLAVNAEMTQVIEETTRAQQVIKIFGGQDYEKERFNRRAENLRSYTMRMTAAFSSTVPITQLMTATAVAVVIVMALIQSGNGQITVGGFVSFITAMLMLLTPLKQLAEINGPLQRGMAAAEEVYKLIDKTTERITGEALAGRATGQLDFVEVGFAYPGHEQLALKNINLHVEAGETIAFVGMSGGGKSTLVSLIPGFYSCSSGEIRLDGRDIETISLPSLRQQIAMVNQNTVLFDDTLAANIAYGDANPDPARVEAAVEAAHLTDVVAGLPEGLQTRLGDNGSRLSGGQRQRVAIARAIYKDAPILILDEATSALDTESERAVQAALDRLMQGRTTFVIAHRLSTIERADRIVVLAHGQIAEIGTHQALLEQEGVYANLYRLQFSQQASV